jgi:hypothetical protein
MVQTLLVGSTTPSRCSSPAMTKLEIASK